MMCTAGLTPNSSALERSLFRALQGGEREREREEDMIGSGNRGWSDSEILHASGEVSV